MRAARPGRWQEPMRIGSAGIMMAGPGPGPCRGWPPEPPRASSSEAPVRLTESERSGGAPPGARSSTMPLGSTELTPSPHCINLRHETERARQHTERIQQGLLAHADLDAAPDSSGATPPASLILLCRERRKPGRWQSCKTVCATIRFAFWIDCPYTVRSRDGSYCETMGRSHARAMTLDREPCRTAHSSGRSRLHSVPVPKH